MGRKRIWKRVIAFMLAFAMVLTGLTISPREAKAAGKAFDISELGVGIEPGASLTVAGGQHLTGTEKLEYGDEITFKVSIAANARFGIGYGSYGVYFKGNTTVRYCNDLLNITNNLGRGPDSAAIAISSVAAETPTLMKLKIEEQDASYMKLTLTIYANDEDATGTVHTMTDIPRKTGTEDELYFHAIDTLNPAGFTITSVATDSEDVVDLNRVYDISELKTGIAPGASMDVAGLQYVTGTRKLEYGTEVTFKVSMAADARLGIGYGSYGVYFYGSSYIRYCNDLSGINGVGNLGRGSANNAVVSGITPNTPTRMKLKIEEQDASSMKLTLTIYANDEDETGTVYTVTDIPRQTGTEDALYFHATNTLNAFSIASAAEPTYNEMWFGHWSENLGTEGVFGGTVYGLPEGTLTSLDGVAISGNVKFETTNRLHIGSTEALKHGGFWLWKDDNGLHLSPQGIGGDGGDSYAIHGDTWTAIKDKTFLLRLTFNDIGTGWAVGIHVNGTYIQTLTYKGVTTPLVPGTLIDIEPGVNVDMTLPSEPSDKEYTELNFSDWGVSEGNHYGTDVYSLTDKSSITSLNGVAISGNICFAEEGKMFKIGGTTTVPHGGFFIWDDGSQLNISPQEIGLSNSHAAIHGETWEAVKGKTFLLRLTFEEKATEWVVGIYVNGEHYQDLTFTKDSSGKVPGLFLGVDAGVTVDMGESGGDEPEEDVPATKVIFPTAETVTVSDPALNGVTDAGITYAGADGQIAYETKDAPGPFIGLFGAYEDINASVFLLTNGANKAFVLNFVEPIKVSNYNRMEINMFMCGYTSADPITTSVYASGASSLAADKAKDVFTTNGNQNVEQTWTLDLEKYADADGYVRNLTFLYNPNVVDLTTFYAFGAFRLSKVREYTTLTFSDWGMKDGTYSDAARNFALKDESITSLDGYAFEGYVNYHGSGSYLKVAGIESNPHYALQVWAVTSNQIAMVNHLNLDNGQPIFTPDGYSASEYAKIRLTFDETAKDKWTIGFWVNDTYMGDMKLTNTALGTNMLYGGSAISVKSTVSGLDYDNQVNYEEYMTPIWDGETVYDESVMPLTNADGSISPIALMYDIDEIISVKSADLQTTYTAGTDYVVEDGKLVIPSGSAITVTQYSDYYFATAKEGTSHLCTDGRYTYSSEDGWFHNRQIVVTYTHSDEWTGSKPEKQGDNLANVQEKLANKEPITVAFYGDSITEGANSSAFLKKEPRLETYAELVVESMRRTYGYEDIHYVNTALGGQTTAWGAENAQNRVAVHDPDLVFIAFGMNDPLTELSDYQASIESIINTVRASNADCDIVLVGTMLPNEEVEYVYGNQVEFVDVLNTIADEYSNIAVADVTNVHKTLLETKSYRDMTGNNVNHPNDFLGRVYAQVLMETLAVGTAGDGYTELTFADWDEWVEYNAISKGDVYSLSNRDVKSLNGVSISGDIKFALPGALLCIGSTEMTKHGGFWIWATDSGLILSPQGIGTVTSDAAVYIVSGDIWNAVKNSYFNLRMSFDKIDAGWALNVYVNEELSSSLTIEGNLTPGTYMSIGSGIYPKMVDENEDYQELTFSDWGMYDGIVPYPNEHRVYWHKLNYTNITSLEGYAFTGTISFDCGYWRIGSHNDSASYGIDFQVKNSTLQFINWLDASPSILTLYTFAENETIASAVPLRIEFEKITDSVMKIHVYVNNSHKRTLELNVTAQSAGQTVQTGTNMLTENTNGNMKVHSDKNKYKELTFNDFQCTAGGGEIGRLLQDGKVPAEQSIYTLKYGLETTLKGYALTGRVTFGNGAFRFAGTNSGGFHGVELSVSGNQLRLLNHKNAADTNNLPALYVGDDAATREFLIRIEFEELTDTELAFTIYVDGITKQSYEFTNTLVDYPFGASLWFYNPGDADTPSVKSVENVTKLFADGIYVKDLTKDFVVEKDAVLVNGHLRTDYPAGSKVTLQRGIYQMFYKEQMTVDTCDLYAYIQGDLNEDKVGECDSTDLVRGKKALADQSVLSKLGFIAGDFNLDGVFDELDITMLKKHLLSADEIIMVQRPVSNGTVDLLGNKLGEAVSNYTTDNYGAIDNLNLSQEDIHGTNVVKLDWVAKAGATYKVYVSEKEDMSDAIVYKTDDASLELYNLIPATTYYWKVKVIFADDSKVVSDVMSFTTKDSKIRTIVIDGVPNTRDIGGLLSADGTKRIKYGILYRGGTTNYITELGREQASMLGVRTELDLRSSGSEAIDTKAFGENVNYINIPGVHYAIQVESNYATIAEELKVFAVPSAYPVYFHCSLGRDRTGTLAFLLEALAGVSEDDLLLDYELSRLSYIGSVTATNEELLPNYMNMYNVINTLYEGATFQEKTWNYLKDIGLTESEIILIYENITEDVVKESEGGYERMALYYGLAEPCKEFNVSNAESYVTRDFTAEVAGGFGVSTYRIWVPAIAYTRVAEEGSKTAVAGYEIAFDESQLAIVKDWVAKLQANGVKQILLCQSNFVVLDDQPCFIMDNGKAYSSKELREDYGNAYPPGTTAVFYDSAAVPEFGTEKYEQFLAVQQAYYDMLTDAIPGITHIEAMNEPEGNGIIHRFGSTFTHEKWNTPAAFTTTELARACMDYCYAITKGVEDKNVKVLSPALMTVEGNSLTTNDTSVLLKAFYDYIAGKGETMTFADTTIDNYFQVLNWHPYVHLAGNDPTKQVVSNKKDWDSWYDGKGTDMEWVDYQKMLYQIALDAGDYNTPVWFTEFGVTDVYGQKWGNYVGGTISEQDAAERLAKMFELVQSDLEFVQAITTFRISDWKPTVSNNVEHTECSYGMLESFLLESSADACLKPIGETYYEIVNGADASKEKILAVIRKHYNAYYNISPAGSELVDFVVDVESGREPVVLQLTDTQIIDASQQRSADRLNSISSAFWAKDRIEENCYDYLTETIRETNPDLILVTGDLVYGEFDDNGSAFTSFVNFMESFKIPWAPIFGNHDAETALGIDYYCDMLEAAQYCVFKQRELTGNGNYTVGICQDNELKRVFFMLDSNGCGAASSASLANGHTITTHGFGQDQINWYTSVAQSITNASPRTKLSFAFHIQLEAFEEAYAGYGFDSSKVTSSNILANPINIDVHENKKDGDFGYLGRGLKSSWDTNKTIYNGLKALGVDSIFVGHEHCNSGSVVYDGIRFQYGQKSSTYDRVNYVDESTGVVTGGSCLTTLTPLVGGTVMSLDSNGEIINPYIYLCENAGGKINWNDYVVIDENVNGLQNGTDLTTATVSISKAEVAGKLAWQCYASGQDKVYVNTALMAGKTKFTFSVYVPAESTNTLALPNSPVFAIRVKPNANEPGSDGTVDGHVVYSTTIANANHKIEYGKWQTFTIDITGLSATCTEFAFLIAGGNTIYLKDIAFE